MKTYIFFTFNIFRMGGGQMYVASKAKYLKSIGWKTIIIYPGGEKIVSHKDLEEYKNGEIIGLNLAPHRYFTLIRNIIINDILRKINLKGNESEIIIESNDDTTALWAELIANKLNAKHVCFNCNETFRGIDKENYLDKIEFFDFKHKRRELACINKETVIHLFEGYKAVPDDECFSFQATNYGPVQNIKNGIDLFLKKHLKTNGWNICYIGRINKLYVDNILKGVYEFAKKHLEKNINFIFVGDISLKRSSIFSFFKELKNVNLIELGNLLPIPQNIFAYFDVVIAGAGCARCSLQQHRLTIIPDAKNFRCNGVLGLDTFNTLFAEQEFIQTTFGECLEKVLVKKSFSLNDIKWSNPRPIEETNKIYDKQFMFINNSEKTKCYYNIKKLCFGKKRIRTNIGYFYKKIKSLFL